MMRLVTWTFLSSRQFLDHPLGNELGECSAAQVNTFNTELNFSLLSVTIKRPSPSFPATSESGTKGIVQLDVGFLGEGLEIRIALAERG